VTAETASSAPAATSWIVPLLMSVSEPSFTELKA